MQIPAGDHNRSKGKDGYPTIAFECTTGYNRELFFISSIHFGTRNNTHIVKLDKHVANIHDNWYNAVQWDYFDKNGCVMTAVGV